MDDTQEIQTEEINNAFVGGYVPERLKLAVKSEAREQQRTVSQQLIVILRERYAAKKQNRKR